MFRLITKHWPYLILSIVSSLVFVALNSASIWLTASLINNILVDFNELISEHKQMINHGEMNFNESIKYWINGLILRDTPQDTLKVLCLTIMIVFVLKNVFLYIKNLLMSLVQFHLITELRNALYRHFHSLSLSYFNKKKSGELTALLINDVTNINKAFGTSFHELIVEPINIAAIIVLLLIINWKLAILSLVIVPLAGFLIIIIGKSIRRKSKRTAAKIAGITNIITETFASIRVVKAFGMKDYEISRFMTETKKYFKLLVRRARLRLIASPATEALGVLMGVLLLWIGGLEVLSGQGLTSEDFLRFVILLFAMLEPLRKLSDVNVELQMGAASAERVFAILDTPPTINNASDAVIKTDFKDKIMFKNVYFQYDDREKSALKNTSLTIEKGSVVALVGPSGAGKTTIADLIPRFFDVSGGSIEIDGIDIRKVTIESLRNLMGIVTQETLLFNDTVASNIAYGQISVDLEKVKAAAKAANALEFIEQMPEGFNSIIGEKGVKLSGGQRQRLAIARAIMKNPPIMILDEATSALDTESERLVQDAIEKLMIERTVLVIAHRLSTVKNAHKIIVMDKGEIVNTGTHEQLIQKEGLYKKLYDVQFSTKI